jgi:ATP/maltotriose-dependent transcriptional regulator MalT
MTSAGTGTEAITLVSTKLNMPRVIGDVINRPHLMERLKDGPRPVAWLSLDQDDSDLVVFLTYVVAAIRTIFPDACPQTQSLGQAPQMPPVDYIASTFINEIADLPAVPSADPGFILVLDDFHAIYCRNLLTISPFKCTW